MLGQGSGVNLEDRDLACAAYQFPMCVIMQAGSEEEGFFADKPKYTLGILQTVILVTEVLSP